MLLVQIDFQVYETTFEGGQGHSVNGFSNEQLIYDTNDKFVAINKRMDEQCLSFDKDLAEIEENGTVVYTNLVDKDNIEVYKDSPQYEKWKAGEIMLYDLVSYIHVFELNKI